MEKSPITKFLVTVHKEKTFKDIRKLIVDMGWQLYNSDIDWAFTKPKIMTFTCGKTMLKIEIIDDYEKLTDRSGFGEGGER